MAPRPPPRPIQCPPTESVPEGNPDTTPGHPSQTGPTPDRDRETMPPQTPRPPQSRNTDLFDGEELKKIHDIHANTPQCGLVAALRRHLQDVNPNRLFAVFPMPHAASTDISVRQLQALVRRPPCRLTGQSTAGGTEHRRRAANRTRSRRATGTGGQGDEPLKPPPPRTPGVTAPPPDTGNGHPTHQANAQRGSPPWL